MTTKTKNKQNDKHSGNGKGAATKKRILDAAEKLFIRRGYDGVSVNDVAVESRVAKALVFYYFKNKQELFDTVLESYYAAQREALMGAIGRGESLRDSIHAGIDAYLDFIQENPGFPRLIQREICSGSRNIEKIMEYMQPLYQWGLSVFGAILPADGPMSAKHLFISIYGMIINYYTYTPVLERLFDNDPMAGEELAQRRGHIHFMVDHLLAGIESGGGDSPKSSPGK